MDFLFSVLLSNTILFLFYFIIFYKFSEKLKIIDYPDNVRKKHSFPVPAIGGLIIYFSLVTQVFTLEISHNLKIIIISSSLVVLISYLDDSIKIGILPRLISQVFASLIIIGFNISISYIGSYPIIGEIYLSNFSFLFTLFCILLVTNAYNFIDGIDGLTSTQFLISLLIILFYIYFENPENLKSIDIKLVYILIFLSIMFLILNLGLYPTKKIFLGDNGSNLLGFILGWIIIYFALKDYIPSTLCIWVVSLPCIDLLRVFIDRIKLRKNPFHPDRLHIHFLFKEKNYSNSSILFLLSFGSVIFGFLGYISFIIGGDILSILTFVIIVVIYNLSVKKFLS